MRIVGAAGPRRPDLLPSDLDLASAFTLTRDEPSLSAVRLVRAGDFFVAIDCQQPTGSFKVRGATFALREIQKRGITRVLSASAGNHGAGLAFAARRLGLEAIVVVPTTTPRKKVDNIRSLGATLIERGAGYDEAENAALAMARDENVPYLSPYDDPQIVAGNGASLGAEISTDARIANDATFFVPIGGGGLATGIALAWAKLRGRERVVWGVQSEASAAFALSLESGAAVTTLPPATTIADGLEGGIAKDAFARAAGVLAGAIVVSEAAIERAMRFAYRDLGLVIEGSAATALVPVLEGHPRTGGAVVVLTGRNVDPERHRAVVM